MYERIVINSHTVLLCPAQDENLTPNMLVLCLTLTQVPLPPPPPKKKSLYGSWCCTSLGEFTGSPEHVLGWGDVLPACLFMCMPTDLPQAQKDLKASASYLADVNICASRKWKLRLAIKSPISGKGLPAQRQSMTSDRAFLLFPSLSFFLSCFFFFF